MSQILPNIKTTSGATPLIVAAKYAQRSVIETLIKDPRVDLNSLDLQGRSALQLVGAALVQCDEAVRNILCDLIRTEIARRTLKRRKIESTHPEQILVRQAREKLAKLINDLEEVQRVEMTRFQENIENDRREFRDKQDEEKENFMLKIVEEERLFYYNQDIQRSKFMSKMSRKKFQFERMQQELSEEFSEMEKHKLELFKDKQVSERDKLLSNQTSQDKTQRWSSSSLEVAQLTGNISASMVGHKIETLNSSMTNITGAAAAGEHSDAKQRNLSGSATPDEKLPSLECSKNCVLNPRKLSCPPRLATLSSSPVTPSTPPPSPAVLSAHLKHFRSRISPTTLSSSTSLNPSPVPSLEFIPSSCRSNDIASSIPDTCPNIKALIALKLINQEPESKENSSEPPSPIINHHYLTYPLNNNSNSSNNNIKPSIIPAPAVQPSISKTTPRFVRKNRMEVVTEESDDNDDNLTLVENETDSDRKRSLSLVIDRRTSNSSSSEQLRTSAPVLRSSTSSLASVQLNKSRESLKHSNNSNHNKDDKCRVI